MSDMDAAVEAGAESIADLLTQLNVDPHERPEEAVTDRRSVSEVLAGAVIDAALPVLLPPTAVPPVVPGRVGFYGAVPQPVHHKDGPLAQLAQMADWAEDVALEPARNADWETAGKIAKNIRSVLPFLAGGLPREPSEAAARAFDQAYEDAPLAPWVEDAALAEQDVSETLAGLRAAYRIDSSSKPGLGGLSDEDLRALIERKMAAELASREGKP